MVKQAGKTHNYPSSRSSYSTSRKGVGGRPRKNAVATAKTPTSTLFSHFQRQQSQSGLNDAAAERPPSRISSPVADSRENFTHPDVDSGPVISSSDTAAFPDAESSAIVKSPADIATPPDVDSGPMIPLFDTVASPDVDSSTIVTSADNTKSSDVESSTFVERGDNCDVNSNAVKHIGPPTASEDESSSTRSSHYSKITSDIESSDSSSSDIEDSESESSDASDDHVDEDNSDTALDVGDQVGNQCNSPKDDKHSFRKTAMAELQRHYSWLYFDAVNDGYKCKVCELFPEGITGSRGKNKHKFSDVAVKTLTDHPKRTLDRHVESNKHKYAAESYENFRSTQTIQALERKRKAKVIRDSEVTELALEKLLRITVFIVKKHWAHIKNYQDFVKFIGNDLKEHVLEEYLKLCKGRKNATYLSEFTVAEFLKLIGEYMENEALKKVRDAEQFTIMLDESTDEANRAELAVIARVVDSNGEVENHFLTLLQLSRCDALTIFTAVYDYLKKNNIDLTKVRFTGMDGCSTMLGDHNGVTVHFKENSSHHSSIHCRNHRLALCFAHLIPFHKEFETFDGLLLNLYLSMKNSTVKSSIFDEVQKSYDLTSLKLIKAAVTRWLSHGKAAQRVLDRYQPLVEALNTIYERKKEPAVQGIIQQLTTPDTIASLCILADILESTNSLQVFLQHAHLNFLDLPGKVDELLTTLESIRDDPCRPNSNFGDLDNYLDIASKQERVHVTRSRSTPFSKQTFISNVVKPFVSDLIQEIKTAFEIPDHLVGFTAFDPQKLPRDRDELDSFGNDLIEKLCDFYGGPYALRNNEFLPKVIDSGSLKAEYEIFKVFAFKERFNYELQQREKLDRSLLQKEKIEKALSAADLSKKQRSKKKSQLKVLEEELVELRKT